jgi:uncharacterized Zn-finger protein
MGYAILVHTANETSEEVDMGKRKRLNGHSVPLDSEKSKTCPNCGRSFREYKLIQEGEQVRKVCPYCKTEID